MDALTKLRSLLEGRTVQFEVSAVQFDRADSSTAAAPRGGRIRFVLMWRPGGGWDGWLGTYDGVVVGRRPGGQDELGQEMLNAIHELLEPSPEGGD